MGGTSPVVGSAPSGMLPQNCGTQNDGVHSYEADVWSAGVTIYEMLTGWMSFGRDDNTPTADWYLAPVVVPLTFDEQKDTLVNDDARDLLRKMLEVDPIKRVTIEEIKEHTYFQSIDWKQIVARVPIMGDHTATHSPDMKQKPARIPYAPPYKAYEDLYSWFEWVSPALNRCTEDHHGDDAPDNPVTDTFLCFGDDHEHPTPCISVVAEGAMACSETCSYSYRKSKTGLTKDGYAELNRDSTSDFLCYAALRRRFSCCLSALYFLPVP